MTRQGYAPRIRAQAAFSWLWNRIINAILICIKQEASAIRFHSRMTESVFKTVFELIFFGSIPLLLTVVVVWFVWYVLETIDNDEVKHFRSFLTFVLVVVPFVMLCLGGLTVLIFDQIEISSSGQPLLPLPPF